MTILKQIDKTICLLLDKRIQYWSKIKEDFERKGISVERFLVGDGHLGNHYDLLDINEETPRYDNSTTYPTWFNRPNAYNCWRGHSKILNDNKGDNTTLMLLEDDVFIEEDFDNILDRTSKFFKKTDWDMIYLGGYHRDETVSATTHNNVVRVNGSAGFHGVILRPSIIKILAEYSPIGPMDWITGKYLHPKYNCYAIFPSILSQLDNIHSYVENQILIKPSRDTILE